MMQSPEFKVLRDAWYEWDQNNESFINHRKDGIDEDQSTESHQKRFQVKPFLTKLDAALDEAIAYLVIVEQHADFTMMITSKMQGGSDVEWDDDYYTPVEIDLADVKLLHSGLVALKSVVALYDAYELDPITYSFDTILAALGINNNTFLALKDQSKLVDVLADSKLAVELGIEAINLMITENDDQGDDLINADNAMDDLFDIKENLIKVQECLNGSCTRSINGYDITINIPEFVADPIQNLKNLVDYDVYKTYNYSTEEEKIGVTINELFDKTFGGLFNDDYDIWREDIIQEFICGDIYWDCYDGDYPDVMCDLIDNETVDNECYGWK